MVSQDPDSHEPTTVYGSDLTESAFDRRKLIAPTLTVLWHPEIHRVGDWYALTELESGVALTRKNPPFGSRKEPLNDPGVSRRPLRFSALPRDGLRIDPGGWPYPRVEVDFEPLVSILDLTKAQLEHGLVLSLGNRVVLLLHRRELGAPDDIETDLVGVSSAMERVRNAIEHAAPTDAPVLIRGETGTGKELVASALHAHSARGRKSRPFVKVNLGAIPSNQVATELFGSKGGAYTGVRARKGYFERADKGTLFLDEIGETSTETQVALLRAVETGEIQPSGSNEPTQVDVRILAATDANLEESGFRAPLLHRLSTHVIEIPPLRERLDDIGCLFVHFLKEELGPSFDLLVGQPRSKPWIHPAIVARLATYDWPGNVRELQNVVRQLVAANRIQGDPKKGKSDSFSDRMRVPRRLEELLFRDAAGRSGRKLATQSRRPAGELSREDILEILERADWVQARASEDLGISHQALGRLMRKHEIRRAVDLGRDEIDEAASHSRDARETAARLRVSERALLFRVKALGLDLVFDRDGDDEDR